MSEAPAAGADSAERNRADSKAAGIYLYSRSAASLLLLAVVFLGPHLYTTIEFAYVQAILLIYETAISLGSLGLADAVFYFVGRHPERASAIVRQTSGLLLVAALPVVGAVTIAAIAMSSRNVDLIPALPWLAIALLLELPTQPAVNQLLAGGHAIMASVLFVTFVVLRTAAVMAPAMTGWPLETIPIVMAALGLLRLLTHVFILRAFYPLPRGERWVIGRELRAILAFSLPAGLAATVGKINPQIDKYVVNIVVGDAAFAVYTTATWELPLITLIPFAIGAVMQVRYVRLYASERYDELRLLWYQTAEKTTLAVVPLAILVIVVAEDVFRLILPDPYLSAVTPFRIFTLILLHRVAAYGSMLQAIGRTRLLVVTSTLLLVTNLILTVPMTLLLGSNGAALATLLANVPAWVVCLHFVGRAWGGGLRNALPWRFYSAVLALACAIGAATWFALRAVPDGSAGLRLGAGCVIYLAMYVAIGRGVGLLRAEDLAFLRRWLSFGLIK